LYTTTRTVYAGPNYYLNREFVKNVFEQIFVHGFTTKKNGHGFGLHFCANAIKEMGGELLVQSEGTNRGSTFTIKLRLKENQNDQV
jgi:signal transduction histidine kinase